MSCQNYLYISKQGVEMGKPDNVDSAKNAYAVVHQINNINKVSYEAMMKPKVK